MAILASGALMAVRLASAVTLERPYLGGTSGCEEEALFSIWKAANGAEVYNNPWLPPFSASYFGWLFYEVYGLWVNGGLSLAGSEDAWLPTFARLFTLLGWMAGIILYWWVLRLVWGKSWNATRWLLPGLALLAFISPLFHWWSFTARPDIWALALELVALLAAVSYSRQSKGCSWVFVVGIAAFLAWSFRPTNISVLVGFGCWLLFAGRLKVLFALAASMAIAFATTISLLGRNFIESVFVANSLSGEVLFVVALRNLTSSLSKDPLMTLSILAAMCLLIAWRRWWHDGVLEV